MQSPKWDESINPLKALIILYPVFKAFVLMLANHISPEQDATGTIRAIFSCQCKPVGQIPFINLLGFKKKKKKAARIYGEF